VKKVYAVLCKAETALTAFCLLGATLILCFAAILRTAGHPILYTTELALFLFAWGIFLGADAAYRKNKLVYVEIIIDRIPQVSRRVLYGVNYLLIVLFLVIFMYQSVKLVRLSWIRPWPSIPWLSYGWIALSIPVGSFLLLLTTGIQIYRYVIRGETPDRGDAAE
jgi:TRAP-type C4-dicarboxylate transport system permease small subunit